MLVMAMALLGSPIEVTVREPVAASPWSESVSASCGPRTLIVLRPLSPLGAPPRVTIDGNAVEGDISELVRDLGEPSAAYRFSVLCPQDTTSTAISLRWVRGLSDETGVPTFRAGYAFFRDGRVEETDSFEASAEDFWYR